MNFHRIPNIRPSVSGKNVEVQIPINAMRSNRVLSNKPCLPGSRKRISVLPVLCFNSFVYKEILCCAMDESLVRSQRLLDKGAKVSLAIRYVKGRGRGVVATSRIEAGTTIFQLQPIVWALAANTLSIRCSYCVRKLQKALRCAKCQHHSYCSRECQKKDWKQGHKEECADISHLVAKMKEQTGKILPTSELARAIGRILRLRLTSQSDFEDIMSMHSVRPLLSETQLQNLAISANSASQIVDPKYAIPASEMIDLLAKMTANDFALSDAEAIPCGIAISPQAAMFNSSCWPSAAMVYNGNELLIQALRTIQPGEEICTAYIDVGRTTEMRQMELQRGYHFTCDCERCKANLPVDSTKVQIRCRTPRCTGVAIIPVNDLKPTNCEKCKKEQPVPGNLSAHLELLEENMESIMQASKADSETDVLDICKTLYNDLAIQGHVSILHLPLLMIVRILLLAYMTAQDWSKALEMAALVYEANQTLYPSLHPVTTIGRYYVLRLQTEVVRERNEKGQSSNEESMHAMRKLVVEYQDIKADIEASFGKGSDLLKECDSYVAQIGPYVGLRSA